MLPMRVSHVCATWRQVALRSPSLWRRISLDRRQVMWRERIHRARACSLDVQLRPWMTVWSGFPQHQTLDMYSIQWYMHLVTPHIHRWRSLSITFTDFGPYLWNAALSGCCSRTRAKAPLLTDLSLIYRTNDDTKEFSLFSGFAPNLRRVTLDGLRLTWLPSLFGNLSYLDYTHHNFTRGRQAINDILSMLEVSCRLVELRIMFPRKMAVPLRTPLPQTNRRVLLPILTHLQLRVEGTEIPFELAHLVYLISTPSLVSLRFVDVTRQHYPFPNLQSFFQQYRIPPSVRVLRIEHGWHDPRLVTSVLHNHPSVGYVLVRKPHMSDQIFLLVSRNRKGSRWTANAPTNERHGYVFPTLSLSRRARHPEYTSRPSRREHHWDL
ncbi:hypothetical protein BD779DRAFT_730827 [Infundibulicybe gibba]|nr:hypothetical protein BD779DRAFT_730827 [Infundibulicybe gibba]